MVYMTKANDTKKLILEIGLKQASQFGLESITIGSLAKEMGYSKSGVFARFASKENLQIEILKYVEDDFTRNVITPALKSESGIPRIRKLVDLWINWSSHLTGGCIFVTATTEFRERPGKIRDCLLDQQRRWIGSLKRIAESAIRSKHFREGINRERFAFDIYSMLIGYYYYYQLLDDPGTKKYQESRLDEIIARYSENM